MVAEALTRLLRQMTPEQINQFEEDPEFITALRSFLDRHNQGQLEILSGKLEIYRINYLGHTNQLVHRDRDSAQTDDPDSPQSFDWFAQSQGHNFDFITLFPNIEGQISMNESLLSPSITQQYNAPELLEHQESIAFGAAPTQDCITLETRGPIRIDSAEGPNRQYSDAATSPNALVDVSPNSTNLCDSLQPPLQADQSSFQSKGPSLQKIDRILDNLATWKQQHPFDQSTKAQIAKAISRLFDFEFASWFENRNAAWHQTDLWQPSDLAKPCKNASVQTNLATAYMCISQLDTRMEQDPVRARLVCVNLYTEYSSMCEQIRSNNFVRSTDRVSRGRGEISLIIDEILRHAHKDWDEVSEDAKIRFRAHFHASVMDGKRWLILADILGQGILLTASIRAAKVLKRTTFTDEMLHATAVAALQYYPGITIINSSLNQTAQQLLEYQPVENASSPALETCLLREQLLGIQSQAQALLQELKELRNVSSRPIH